MPFGNVKVNYSPCRSVGQLKSAVNYILGRKPEQLREGVIKTKPHLYTALGCNRENFANSIMITRKLWGKSYSRLKPNTILAHKLSISFHPQDCKKLTPETAYKIAKQFAQKHFGDKGYEVLMAVHIDREHIHAHFIVSNCSTETGKSFRRGRKELYEMSEYFGRQCEENGLTNSVRESFYSDTTERRSFAEEQMKNGGRDSFKDALREVIQIEIADPLNKSFEDVIRSLKKHYNVESRVAGNTVAYRHPEYKDKNGKPVSIRGNRLGELYTRKGIENELNKKRQRAEQLRSTSYGGARPLGAGAVDESVAAGAGTGQAAIGSAAYNGGETLRDFDRLYEQYRKRAEQDKRNAAAASESSEPIQDDDLERD